MTTTAGHEPVTSRLRVWHLNHYTITKLQWNSPIKNVAPGRFAWTHTAITVELLDLVSCS